jgi:hypothetical protein
MIDKLERGWFVTPVTRKLEELRTCVSNRGEVQKEYSTYVSLEDLFENSILIVTLNAHPSAGRPNMLAVLIRSQRKLSQY